MAGAVVEESVPGDVDVWDAQSEESSFYGDEELKTSWEARVVDFDEEEYWKESHDKLVYVLAHRARPTSALCLQDGNEHLRHALNGMSRVETMEASEISAVGRTSVGLHNRLDGWKHAKQLDETVSEFLQRAPPLDSLWSPDGWLWVFNPHAAPYETRPDIEVFTSIGSQYLSDYSEQRRSLEAKNPNKVASTITKMLKPARGRLKADIEQLASTNGVVHGKWMLFPHVSTVAQVWRVVLEGVTENRLGDVAKIATGSNKEIDDGLRVICIYTKDFTDTDDVKRVCKALDDLQLIPAEKGIFYKADAYTYLNITSNNPYSIPASLYSSREVLMNRDAGKATERGAPLPTPMSTKRKEPVRKKQATLDGSF